MPADRRAGRATPHVGKQPRSRGGWTVLGGRRGMMQGRDGRKSVLS